MDRSEKFVKIEPNRKELLKFINRALDELHRKTKELDLMICGLRDMFAVPPEIKFENGKVVIEYNE